MSSKSLERRSIASQLVVLFTLSAALLLGCGLGVLYLTFIRHAYEEDNEVLADKVYALSADLEKDGDVASLNQGLKTHAGEHVAYLVRLIDSQGKIVAETPGMAAMLPTKVFPSQHAITSLDSPKAFRTAGQLFSLLSTQVSVQGDLHTLQVAQDRSGDDKFAKEFGALLVVVLVFGSVASAVIGINVTKRGLRPLEEMTRSLQVFGPERLHERTPPYEWPRELRPLALAFNSMFERLEGSFTRLSQFSADLAHELRTPIANIRGEGEVALTRTRTPEEYREVIESNVTECERLSQIVDNLLFLARAEAAEEYVKRSELDGREAVEKIATFYEPIAEEHKSTISCLGEGKIWADPLLFGRAVSNLVENALRYTPSGGLIEISINSGATEAKISVKDTGTGIAPEHLPRVFDRFYRADASRTSEGTGLGLALVKSIMQLHGGSAVIESQVGRGTTVTLTFPVNGVSPMPVGSVSRI